MSKYLLITKINLLSFFNLQRVNNSKYKSVNKKNYAKLLLLLFVFLYLAFYIYYISNEFMPGLIELNVPYILFGLMFLVVSVFIITSNILRIKGVLFDFKDHDLLFSLPLKRTTILLSKFTSLYILNLIYTILFMVPTFIAYVKYLPLDSYILYFLLLFIIPIVPMIASIIIGVFISLLASKFINKTVGSYIVNLTIIAIAFFVSFKMNGLTSVDMANFGSNSISSIGRFYPLVNNYLRLITEFNIKDLLIFLIIPIILLVVMIFILNILYDKIRGELIKSHTSNDYKIKNYQVNKPIISLYKKEMKRFFANSMYPLNSIFGCLLLVLMVIGIIIFNENTIASLFNIKEFSDFFKNRVLLIISLCCVLSSTTHCAISLEGKSFWIIKMIPIKGIKILLSKLFVNLTFLLPTIIIASTFFGIYLHLGFVDFLLLYLIPIGYALFTAQMGLLFNLLDPKFDFTNEIQVIKQALPVFLTMIIGIISVIVPLTLKEITTSYCIMLTIVIFIIDIILFITLNTYGVKKLERL